MGRRAQDPAIALPGTRGIALLRASGTLQQHENHEVSGMDEGVFQRMGLTGRTRDPLGAIGAPQEQRERLTILLHPAADLRIGLGPDVRRIRRIDRSRPLRRVRELGLRPPEEAEGILILGDLKRAELRHVEWIADVGEPIQAGQPPDREYRTGHGEEDCQAHGRPQQLPQPLPQQLHHLTRRLTRSRRRDGRLLKRGRHGSMISQHHVIRRCRAQDNCRTSEESEQGGNLRSGGRPWSQGCGRRAAPARTVDGGPRSRVESLVRNC